MRFSILLSVLVLIVNIAFAQDLKTINNLNASGKVAYFNLASGKEVTQEDNWDISFQKTTIALNNNANVTAQVAASTFDKLDRAPAAGYKPDTEESKAIPTGSGNGWYNYNMEDHSILPIADRTIVVKATDGKKYKIKIISYNKDQKLHESSGYYTFQYTVIK